MLNKKYLEYTFMHRKAFLFVVNKLIKNPVDKDIMLIRAKWHDLDKAFLYTLIDKKTASAYHRRTAPHHMEPLNETPKDKYDIMEAVFDFECAGYTKEDKPLNAYDTIRKYSYTHTNEMMKVIRELGIAESYRNTPHDPEWLTFLEQQPKITYENMQRDIYLWIFKKQDMAKNAFNFANSILTEK